MEISSQFVGSAIRPYHTQLTSRRTMNFAAAVFDTNPLYLDDRPAGRLVAHPLLACSITWAISRCLADYLQVEDFPWQLTRQQVHYSEHLTWHRPIQADDQLTVTGEIAAIVPHRAGTHMVVRYQADDAQGHPVFTEYTGAMLRGVTCTDTGRGSDNLPSSPPLPDTQVAWQLPLDIHPLAAHIYDGCADMHFPIHTSPAFAQLVGLPGPILHGTAAVSYVVSQLVRREADGDATRVQALDCRFTGMVMPGSQVVLQRTLHQAGADGDDYYWRVVDTNGRPLITDGRLRLARR